MDQAGERKLITAAFAVFATLLIVLNLKHDMWLDELQHWCLARDSSSFRDLLANTRNEGHPPLWHLMLWGLAHITPDPIAMQVLNVCIALGTAAVILWRAPFPLSWRLMIPFGYFFLYEYGAIARNYAIGAFLILLAADQYRRNGPGRRWAFLLILLAQVHLWGLTLSAAWTLSVALTTRERHWPSLALIALSCVIALWRSVPLEQLSYGVHWERAVELRSAGTAGSLIAQAFLPWPDLSHDHPWNTNMLQLHAPILFSVLGWMIFIACLLHLRAKRGPILFFLLSAGGLLAFPVLSDFHGVRYVGPLLLCLLVALWITDQPADQWSTKVKTPVAILLFAQVTGGALAFVMGTTRTFSQARSIVEHMRSTVPDRPPVIVDRYAAGPAISGYLQEPVHYLNGADEGSYCIWWHRPFDLDDGAFASALRGVPYDRFLLVTQRPGALAPLSDLFNVEQRAAFQGGLIEHEDGQVLLLTRTLDPDAR